jgi:hypothetical protein
MTLVSITDRTGMKLTGELMTGAPDHCVSLRVTKGRKSHIGKTVLITRASITKIGRV